jgi:hypothetical protein
VSRADHGSVVQRCESIELSISEAMRAAEKARLQLVDAPDAGAHAKLRSTLDFTETRRRALINERLGIEEARLAEVAANAKAAHDSGPAAELSALSEEFKRLDNQMRATEHLINSKRAASNATFRKMADADAALRLLHSKSPVDVATRESSMRELRDRLDALA